MALWTPAEITTALWLDAADSDSITLDGSNQITQWDDKSGNANNALPDSDNANEFTVLAAEINGNDVVRCPSNISGMRWDGETGSANFNADTIIVVWRWRAPNSSYEHPWTQENEYHGSSSSSSDSPVFGNLGARIGYNADLRVNGAPDGQGSNLTRSTATELFVLENNTVNDTFTGLGYADPSFSGRCPNVDYCEVIAVSSRLSSDDLEKVEGYLAHKWGIEADLPASHPYKDSPPSSASWTPADITTALWLDANDSDTITTDGSGNVTQWDDKSGNDRHSTPRKGTITVDTDAGGYQHVNVDAGALDLPALGISGSQNRSVFVVADLNGNQSGCAFFTQDWDGGNGNRWCLRQDNNGTNLRLEIQGSGYTSSLDATAKGIFAAIQNGSTLGDVTLYVDGASESASGASSVNTNDQDNSLGLASLSTNAITSPYYDVIVLPSAASTENRQKVEGYLAHKWGLEGLLPADHPYKSEAPTVPDPEPTGTATGTASGSGTGSGSSSGVAPGIIPLNLYLLSITLPDVPTEDPEPEPAIEVTWDYDPVALGAALWLDASADDGITVSDGRVESFVDQSGSGRDFLASGANRPYLNGAQNGVEFKNDAGEQDSSTSDVQYLSYSGSDLLHGGEWEVWAVVSSVANDSRGVVISTREYSGTIHKRVDTTKVQFFGSTSNREAFYKSDHTQGGKSDQSPDVLEARMVTSGIYARLNNESERQGSTANDTGSLAFTSTLIGAEDTGGMVDSFKGVIHELIVVKGGTTEAERENLRTELIKKWDYLV